MQRTAATATARHQAESPPRTVLHHRRPGQSTLALTNRPNLAIHDVHRSGGNPSVHSKAVPRERGARHAVRTALRTSSNSLRNGRATASPTAGQRVPDGLLDRVAKVTTEEAWGVLWGKGYKAKFVGDWKIVHPGQVLVGRRGDRRLRPPSAPTSTSA